MHKLHLVHVSVLIAVHTRNAHFLLVKLLMVGGTLALSRVVYVLYRATGYSLFDIVMPTGQGHSRGPEWEVSASGKPEVGWGLGK